MFGTIDPFQNPCLPQHDERLSESRIVPRGTMVSRASQFSDPVWKMEDLVTLPGVTSCVKYWDFRTVPGFPGGFALTLAEYSYARLYKPLETHGSAAKWLTIYNELTALNGVAKFLSYQGIESFSEVDNILFERYLQFILFSECEVERKSEDRARTIFAFIYRLWEYGVALSEPIPSIPFGKPFKKLFKGRKRCKENKTPVIPEPVFKPLMAVALDYVCEYRTTIIKTWIRLQTVWNKKIRPLSVSESSKITKLRISAEKIIARQNSPWRKTKWSSYGDLCKEVQQLRVSCHLTILAFSGIRCSELLSMEYGCRIKDEGRNDQTIYRLETRLHKNHGGGKLDDWIVIKEVHDAIRILEILTQRVRTASNDNRLMITDGESGFFSVQKDFRDAKLKEFTSSAVIAQIERFRNYCNNNLNLPNIPELPDNTGSLKPWKFNLRQFRRTLARHIARQPFGVIAGMLQYKHVEVTIFEGYAGSDPEWNKMLTEEKVLASIDILEELAIDLSHGAVAGEFGIRIKEEFMDSFRGRAEDYSPSQIAKWLANNYKTLFAGKFNFCFFDPSKALCTHDSVNKDKPILNFCQPAHCGNSCVTKRHAPMWNAQLEQAKEFGEHPKAPEFQRQAMQREISDIESVLSNLKSE